MLVYREFRITNPGGLHTRPGNDFVKTAKQFISDITLSKGDRKADAKSLLKLMKADVVQGDIVTVSCNGPDETEAMSAIDKFLSTVTG